MRVREYIECPKCFEQVEFLHLHDAAHGIPGTHMQGSERFECSKCGYIVFKEEGTKLGFKFVLD